MAFGFSGGSAENIRPRPPLREDFAVIREEPNLRVAFADDPEEEYEVERLDSQGNATVVGSSSSPDILVPSQAQEHRVVAKNSELGIRGTPSVPKKELKPEHRWQMPKPRNLLSDPESFDPATTEWRVFEATYNGTVANVGPNGETAAKITYDTTNNSAAFTQGVKDVIPESQTGTWGVLIRTVSGARTVDVQLEGDTGGGGATRVNITTDWQLVTATAINPTGGTRRVSIRNQEQVSGWSFYILKAGLNRGQSFEFSTRSQVAQTIPDVVQGADLSNGSTTGADTNDLDFGVDGSGIPFAMSDGDDFTGDIAKYINRHQVSYAGRVYIPSGASGNVFVAGFEGSSSPNLFWKGGSFRLFATRSNSGNLKAEEPNNASPAGSWYSVVGVVDESNGKIVLVTSSGIFKNTTTESFLVGAKVRFESSVSGARLSQLEVHPVLSEAEAEAVRQRLATNPPDPVAPTEAWDFTAETNPHNLIQNSEDFSNKWERTNIASVDTNVVVAPNNTTTADKIVEDNNKKQHGLLKRPPIDGNVRTYLIYAKAAERDHIYQRSGGNDGNYNNVGFSLSENKVVEGGISNLSQFIDYGIKEVGGGWHRCWVTEKTTQDLNLWGMYLKGNTNRVYQGDGTSGVYFWGGQIVRGEVDNAPYVKTTDSIAFPQTVPALRDSSNDLTLGSTSGADTNDGSWVAPVGMAEGGDDRLRAPTKRPTVTWVGRVKYTATRAFGRTANGWKVTATYLVVEDTGGNTKSSAHGKTINDGVYHTLAVTIDEVTGTAEVYIDGATSPDATVDLSTVGALKSSDVELLAEGGTIKQPAYYTRALSGEEIAYLHERLVDNPESAFPIYALS